MENNFLVVSYEFLKTFHFVLLVPFIPQSLQE